MLRKKEVYTVVTPIPGFIPRQLALDILHSHSEVITLNPLVLSHRPISAPRDAAADEFYSTWYEITERVQVVPGAGRIGSSKITFNGCFHDMPWGLQTHTYAPFNIDLRIRYRIAGNQPGLEPPEVREIGLESLGAPQDGLYLREDIEIKANITMVGFVKSTLKTASKEMVQRIIRKAELLDAGVLQAMMSQDGKLKTINPMDRSHAAAAAAADAGMSPTYGPGSPRPMPSFPNPSASPALSQAQVQHGRSNTASSWQDFNNRNSSYSQGYPNQHQNQQYQQYQQQYQQPLTPPPIPPKEQAPSPQPMELPGDFQYHHPLQKQPQPSPSLHPSHAGFAPHHWPAGHDSSNTNSDPRWAPQPSPTSTNSAYGGSSTGGHPSPLFSQQGHTAELPSNQPSQQNQPNHQSWN